MCVHVSITYLAAEAEGDGGPARELDGHHGGELVEIRVGNLGHLFLFGF